MADNGRPQVIMANDYVAICELGVARVLRYATAAAYSCGKTNRGI